MAALRVIALFVMLGVFWWVIACLHDWDRERQIEKMKGWKK